VTLFNRGETVPIEQLDAPKGRDLLKEERLLAERLIHSLEGNFDPADYRDTYQERVHELVEAKRHGKKPKARRVRASRPAASSLTESLRMSLEHAGRRAH
jgi:DNA end-binding protein Ku